VGQSHVKVHLPCVCAIQLTETLKPNVREVSVTKKKAFKMGPRSQIQNTEIQGGIQKFPD
jgi:hypothetical protein